VSGGWDILPTLAELAGAVPRPGIDGLSLAPVLRGRPRAREHAYLYWDYGHARAAFLQAVRAGRWKAVRPSLAAAMELYDLSVDPGEARDVAAQHPAIVKEMEVRMAEAYVPTPDYPIASAARAGGLR
jgi:arylsulfatase A